jgi:hypothetical protein
VGAGETKIVPLSRELRSDYKRGVYHGFHARDSGQLFDQVRIMFEALAVCLEDEVSKKKNLEGKKKKEEGEGEKVVRELVRYERGRERQRERERERELCVRITFVLSPLLPCVRISNVEGIFSLRN